MKPFITEERMISVIDVTLKEVFLQFETSEKLFSPKGIDEGTLAMLSLVEFSEDDKVLDLGCGYGVVGILAAKKINPQQVVMIDVDADAVELAKQNASINQVDGVKILQSNGFEHIEDKEFTLILSNPPYHADFSVPKAFIEKGFNRLAIGGRMYMVTKRKDWYKNKLVSIFGGVRISEINGYFVFMAEKKSIGYAKVKKKK